jgi:ABC-type transport system involved in cytochrome bd biosynthesis fused ATPase/permease subunit
MQDDMIRCLFNSFKGRTIIVITHHLNDSRKAYFDRYRIKQCVEYRGRKNRAEQMINDMINIIDLCLI